MANGRIRIEQAYADGKMLDHSGWKLPRMITPSDIDMVIDFNGRRIILFELKHDTPVWAHVATGQLRMHKAFVEMGQGKIISICAQAVPKLDKPIDTARDITAWQVMAWIDGKIQYSPVCRTPITEFVDSLAE